MAGAGVGLLLAIVSSTHRLLFAGAPAALSGAWPGAACLLVPAGSDVAPHLASYAFLGAILAGFTSGMRVLWTQRRSTRNLVRRCLSDRMPVPSTLECAACEAGLRGRVDVASISAPLAFCYGYLRPRVLVSRALLEMLPRDALQAILIHEREHVRQRDPLKVAVGRLVTSTLFFVPALRGLYERYLIEKELAADAAAVRAQRSSVAVANALSCLLEGGLGHALNPLWAPTRHSTRVSPSCSGTT